MTYKLVSHESGKYTVEFENGGCRPATDVEVALFKQRDELLPALEHLEHNARKSGANMGLALDVARAAIANVKKSK